MLWVQKKFFFLFYPLPSFARRTNPTELRFNTRKYDGKVGLFEQQVLMAQELSRPINPSSANTSGLEGTRVTVGGEGLGVTLETLCKHQIDV